MAILKRGNRRAAVFTGRPGRGRAVNPGIAAGGLTFLWAYTTRRTGASALTRAASGRSRPADARSATAWAARVGEPHGLKPARNTPVTAVPRRGRLLPLAPGWGRAGVPERCCGCPKDHSNEICRPRANAPSSLTPFRGNSARAEATRLAQMPIPSRTHRAVPEAPADSATLPPAGGAAKTAIHKPGFFVNCCRCCAYGDDGVFFRHSGGLTPQAARVNTAPR